MAVSAPELLGVRLADVALAGRTGDGPTVVGGLGLVLDGRGVTVIGPDPGAERTLPWEQTTSLSFHQPGQLPDGRPATVLRLEVNGRPLQFLVPTAHVEPAHAPVLESQFMTLALHHGAPIAAPDEPDGDPDVVAALSSLAPVPPVEADKAEPPTSGSDGGAGPVEEAAPDAPGGDPAGAAPRPPADESVTAPMTGLSSSLAGLSPLGSGSATPGGSATPAFGPLSSSTSGGFPAPFADTDDPARSATPALAHRPAPPPPSPAPAVAATAAAPAVEARPAPAPAVAAPPAPAPVVAAPAVAGPSVEPLSAPREAPRPPVGDLPPLFADPPPPQAAPPTRSDPSGASPPPPVGALPPLFAAPPAPVPPVPGGPAAAPPGLEPPPLFGAGVPDAGAAPTSYGLPTLFGEPGTAAPPSGARTGLGPVHDPFPVAAAAVSPVASSALPVPLPPLPASAQPAQVPPRRRRTRRRLRRRRRLVVAAAVVVVAAGAGAGWYLTRPAAASPAVAAVNVGTADLPAGWLATPAAAPTAAQAADATTLLSGCLHVPTSQAGRLLAGAASWPSASPTFTDDGGTTTVASTAGQVGSAADAAADQAVFDGAGFPACAQQAAVALLGSASRSAAAAGAPGRYPVPAVTGASGSVVTVPMTVAGAPVLLEQAFVTAGPVEAEVSVVAHGAALPAPVLATIEIHVEQRAAAAAPTVVPREAG